MRLHSRRSGGRECIRSVRGCARTATRRIADSNMARTDRRCGIRLFSSDCLTGAIILVRLHHRRTGLAVRPVALKQLDPFPQPQYSRDRNFRRAMPSWKPVRSYRTAARSLFVSPDGIANTATCTGRGNAECWITRGRHACRLELKWNRRQSQTSCLAPKS
jgi:hypothetical protein